MRAVRIVNLDGPDAALALGDVPEPDASPPLTPGAGGVVEVRAAGVSVPELRQTRGLSRLRRRFGRHRLAPLQHLGSLAGVAGDGPPGAERRV